MLTSSALSVWEAVMDPDLLEWIFKSIDEQVKDLIKGMQLR